MRRGLLILIALAAWPTSVSSASQAADAPSQETLSAALALFDGKDLEHQMRSSMAHLLRASLDVQLDALRAQGEEPPEKLVLRLQELVAGEAELVLQDILPTIRIRVASIYASRFTVEELRELKRLQANPVLKKAEALAPEMMAELSRIGGSASAARMPALREKIEKMVTEVLSEEQAKSIPAS